MWSLSQDVSLYSTYSMEVPDRETIHVPGQMEWDGGQFHHSTQNSAQFKPLFISGIFHYIFLDYSWPWMTETIESERQANKDLGGWLY